MTTTTSSMRRLSLRSLLTICAVWLFALSASAQGSKVYLGIQIAAGLASGSDYHNGAKLDFGGVDRAVGLEFRGGYMLNKRTSIFTGLGFGLYHYGLVAKPVNSGDQDTVHYQAQQFVEIPLGIRYATYYGRHSFKTRCYGAFGVKTCFLNDARHDYHSADKTFYGNGLNEESFNKVFLRLFLEGGLDIPMDYDSGILIGLAFSDGLSRNMSTDGPLGKSNYGMLVGQLTLGLRFGL